MARDGGDGVQTVARALAVLGCFRGGGELGITELSRRVELPASTTHRLVTALIGAGFLEKSPTSNRYRIGGALAEYGQIAYRQHRIYLVEPHLEQLATTTGASASIAVRHGNDMVLLGTSRWREADGHELQGLRIPLHASALGRALLAWSDVSEDELARLPFTEGTERAPTDPAGLAKELALTRERGWAFNDEELAAGFRTIGIPLRDGEGRTRFALGLRGTTALMIPERLPFFVDLAKVTADEIAAVLFES
ncbi:IclR family transcriptional regulator [Amycolatopsis azurea]|uniref:Glycerol operon regulatory protein n=1 Tax=Amycolatopsis azurea DSM 43854 TaxID=1238180 RepID=M2QB68_9PSEU|nr:IclR family transcriptional regulator [Amycolatopsis azurea]EMD29290.1 Transcriptional regulator, IclR family [Amycolatopsis azurea DSM 43854]OOC01879.1 transcriptional regulator [Amycolatopsis azurea DSM 43854]